MQLLLLGATGRTGLLVLKEALSRYHTVTALVRSPTALETSLGDHPNRGNLTTVTGSPLSAADIAAALAASPSPVEAVVSTLNPRRASDSPFAAVHATDSPPRMMADSMAGVLTALAEAQSPVDGNNNNNKKKAKVVALSALGAGSSASQAHWLLRLLFRHSNMRLAYEDHDAVEEVLRGAAGTARGVEYVLVRPTRLVEGGEGGGAARVVGAGDGVVGMMETVSRGAVARFLVDAAERGKWDGMAPVVVG